MFSAILAEAGKSIITNILYDVFKSIAQNALSGENKIDENILQEIYEVIDSSIEKFNNKYKDEFGGEYHSFLVREENIQIIIKSFYYGESNNLLESINREGFDSSKKVSEEALAWFVAQLQEYAKEYFNLNKILSEKNFYKTVSNSLEKIENNLECFTNPYILNLDKYIYFLPKNDICIGRDDDNSEINTLLKAGKNIINIYGSSGSGKKTLCKYFINNYRKDSAIFWINYNDDLKSSILRTLRSSEQDLDDIVYEINSAPKYKNSILIISDFNNMNDSNLKLLQRFNIEIFITSHMPFESDYIIDYKLAQLSNEACFRIFQLYFNADINKLKLSDIIYQLISECDNHPMIIKLLAKSLIWNDISLPDLLSMIKQHDMSLDEVMQRPIENDLCYKSIIEHIHDSINLFNLKEVEMDLLTQLSILPFQGVNKSLLINLGYDYKIIFTLLQNGLIEETNNTYSMSRIIQDVVRQYVKPNFNKCENTINYFIENINACYYYAPTILKYIDEDNNNSLILLSINTGVSYLSEGFCEYAKNFFLLAIRKNSLLKNTKEHYENKYVLYANMAACLFNLGDYKGAYENINLAYPQFSNIFKRDLRYDLETLNISIMLFNQIGDFKKAENAYKRALKIIDRKEINNSELLFAVYNNIAKYFVNIEKYVEAESYYKNAKEILEKQIHKTKRHWILWYINYAMLLNDINSEGSTEAKESLDSALALIDRSFLERYIPTIYKELGIYYIRQKKYYRAIKSLKKALEALDANGDFDTNDIEKGKIFYNLGEAYMLVDNFPEAKEFYDKAEKLFVGVELPQNHRFMINLSEAQKQLKIRNAISFINSLKS